MILNQLRLKAKIFELNTQQLKTFAFPPLFKQTDILLMGIWNDLRKCFLRISDSIEVQDAAYLNFNVVIAITIRIIFSDFGILLNILLRNELNNWNKLKFHFFNQLQYANLLLLQSEREKFIEIIKQQFPEFQLIAKRKFMLVLTRSIRKLNFEIHNVSLMKFSIYAIENFSKHIIDINKRCQKQLGIQMYSSTSNRKTVNEELKESGLMDRGRQMEYNLFGKIVQQQYRGLHEICGYFKMDLNWKIVRV
ncbi:unnamed protein product [Paramecium octaurelia]|uniref:Uncharacterized protein n=1 Tax=Paramecium octaurelia TaxID=43137 RepID=A0A8S1TVZ0_PAROT|nr:unnamed protein product [Paramecium octaurelia]